MKSILIIGQSNMSGRGIIGEVPPIEDKRLFMMRNGKWIGMTPPINYDRPLAGINLSESFAKSYVEDTGEEVGIIPCADGGTTISQWQEGEVLFDNAVFCAQLAMRSSEIVAVLWHQGESDSKGDMYLRYKEGFMNMYKALCKRLNLERVPFIAGELGDYLADCDLLPDKPVNYTKINDIYKELEAENSMIGLASAKGLKSKGDFLHFDSASLREFGLRYYREFCRVCVVNGISKQGSGDKKERAQLTEIEKL